MSGRLRFAALCATRRAICRPCQTPLGHPILRSLAKRFGWEPGRFESKPVMRDEPWVLPNMMSD